MAFVHGQWTGVIKETNDELYPFAYVTEYLERPGAEPVSLPPPPAFIIF